MAADVLEVHDLVAGYGPVVVLRGLSMRVAQGQTTAILGANGAGKTTLLRAISNLIPHRAGHVKFDDQPTRGLPTHRLVRRGMVHVPDGRGIFRGMTVLENLQLGAAAVRVASHAGELDRVFQLFPLLAERQRQLAGSLSGGEQQMLAIGKALMAKPRLLLLDEPSHSLAPVLVTEIFRLIAQLKEDGISILLVEQNARKALEVADYGYVLSGGRVVLEGLAERLLHDEGVLHGYLGKAPASTSQKGEHPCD
ncbi:MAG TPA: ABC transporter ATP-binding protein [Chloroflexota bacterium]